MRPPTTSLTREALARLLHDDAPAVAARLLDPRAPAPSLRSFLHPLMGESDRVRVRLAVLGLVELCDAIDAMEADDATLRALSRSYSREALAVSLRQRDLAHALVVLAGELLDLSQSHAWLRCDPAAIAATRDRALRALVAATTTATTET